MAKSGNSCKYKLINTWGKINRSGKNEFESFEEFKGWSLDNGYKPWKNLTLIMDDEGYNSGNCDWVVSRRGSGTANDVKVDKTLDNVVKNIRDSVANITEMKMTVGQMQDTWDALTKLGLVNERGGNTIRRALSNALRELNDAYWSMDTLDLREMDTDGK